MSQMLNDVLMQNHQQSSRSPTSVTVVADAMVLPLFRLNRTNVGMVWKYRSHSHIYKV